MPPITGHGSPSRSSAVGGLPGSARTSHRIFVARVSGLSPSPHAHGRDVDRAQIVSLQGHLMTDVALSSSSPFPRVWSHRSAANLSLRCVLTSWAEHFDRKDDTSKTDSSFRRRGLTR